MITELEIDGFKSFGYPAETIHLERLNFLVGANASGKSNLISALKFIQSAIQYDDLPSSTWIEDIPFLLNQAHASPLRIRIAFEKKREFEINGKDPRHPQKNVILHNFDYELLLRIPEDQPLFTIQTEKLTVSVEQNGKNRIFELNRNADEITYTDLSVEEKRLVVIPIYKNLSLKLSSTIVGYSVAPLAYLRDEIMNWRFFDITPNESRLRNPVGREFDLGESGEYLTSALHSIRSHDHELYDAIIQSMIGVVPGLKTITLRQIREDNSLMYEFHEHGIDRPLPPRSISDGSIRLLDILVIAYWVAKKSSFIAIEEPENGIHPHLSEHLVEIFRDASEECQFLITTHNPSFLDYVETNNILLCDKIDGQSRIRKASTVQEIATFQKHFSLGELWTQGVLGGIP